MNSLGDNKMMSMNIRYGVCEVYDFLKFNFSHFTPQVKLFLGNLKCCETGNAMQRGKEKFSLS